MILSLIYRVLNRVKVQDEITRDMELTFEEARAKARAGWWRTYATFSIKEIGGLFSLPSSQVWWRQAIGWSLPGSAAGWLVSFFWPVLTAGSIFFVLSLDMNYSSMNALFGA